MAVVFSITAVPVFSAVPKKASLHKRLGNVRQQIRDVRHQLAQKKAEERGVTTKLYSTQMELQEKQASLASNKLKLLNAKIALADATQRLARTRKQLERRQQLLDSRIVDIYEGEDLSYLNVILGSTDMATFLTRAYYLKKILDADTQLISQIEADKRQIERDQAIKARKVGEIGSLQVKLISERDRVASLQEDWQNQLDAIENSADLMQKTLDELEAESQRIEGRIRSYQSTPKGRRSYARAFKGGLSLPCNGRITSGFGYRVHPVTGVYKLHTGVDLGVPSGTPIHAAADGTVILAGWMGAYGYAVVIDHGGGVSTLYGHNSKLLVKAGQEVKRGTVIAKSGSTGYSTGPHCHFEKRVNGVPVNPL